MESSSPLERLAAATDSSFPNLLEARERTEAKLVDRRIKLRALEHDSDASIVLMGSWGRAEVTSGSDDDFNVLVNGPPREDVKPSPDDVKGFLDRPPGDQGIFGTVISRDVLAEKIGLDADSNTNLSQRMLFLLESVAATDSELHADARRQILSRYLDESVKDERPPRFLLNDVVRYWRTICVDFAAKEREGPEKWGLRNAKLRTSRKVLFAGGLLPVLDCYRLDRDGMLGFLSDQFARPPTDRIAEAFLRHDRSDAGARALRAYDEFLGRLDDQAFRGELNALGREGADQSQAFQLVRRIGRDIQAGLLALLFETEALPKIVREYAIF